MAFISKTRWSSSVGDASLLVGASCGRGDVEHLQKLTGLGGRQLD
jgi:hypothetical protein